MSVGKNGMEIENTENGTQKMEETLAYDKYWIVNKK